MLRELRIRNLAIIDDLSVRFDKGLNVLTGETGAGKSIIVDALGLALGDRAQSEMIKSGEKETVVQAFFEPGDDAVLPDIGIDMSEGLFLRRVISSSGKSRAYINDTMVTVQTLSDVGRQLVDIHSQHEHQGLLSREKQKLLLDSFGKCSPEAEKVAELFEEAKTLREEHGRLREKMRERAQRIDILRFQINEIEAASLTPGEKEELEEERRILANMTRLKELSEAAYSLIYESEGSCIERLSAAISALKEINGIDSSVAEALQLLESASPMIEDASFSIRGYKDRCDFDPERLDAVEERLDTIKKLERKYGDGIEAVLKFRDDSAKEAKEIEGADERLAVMEGELASKQEKLLKAARALSEKRKKAAARIEDLMAGHLKELAFANAAFRIDVRQDLLENGEVGIGPGGMDRVEFLFSANSGEPPKPLSKIASGGELSRVMLALKSILADLDSIPVLIFDEVDAGIGGRTAECVGRKLDMISAKRQLLCITHLPQIASHGDVHLRIEKNEKAGGVRVDVKEIRGKDRQDEIARMLSGDVTELSLRHAGELLERVK